ncbi:MAG: hypothetical protein IJD64_03600 [Clostridia bacterium]|nr:hypothetical protein [Clostridia bacterium]
MKHCFILNPAAGKGKMAAELREKLDAIERDDVEVYFTTCVGDATDYIPRRVADDPSESYRFYACGGDGTLGEAVCGMMKLPHGCDASLGLVPSGTGNDFVRNFEGGEFFFSMEDQLCAKEEVIDLIRCNDRYAVNMVNVGFDCEVVCKTLDLKKNKLVPKKLTYVLGLIITLIRKPGVRASVSKDGGDAEMKNYLLNTYANGCFCGGGFHSNPTASLTDGRLDALFVNPIGRLRFLSIVGAYKKGTHLDPKYAKVLNHEKLDRVDLAFEKTTNISIDGEVVRADELHLSIKRDALRFLVPQGASMKPKHKKEEKKPAEALSV